MVAAALVVATATPLLAHGAPTCSQMAVAARLMQREVDGFRRSAATLASRANRLRRDDAAKSAALRAESEQFARRADVERDRVDGIVHNVKTCTKSDRDGA